MGSGGRGWGAGGVETNGEHAMSASVLRMLRNVGRSCGSVLQHAATRTGCEVRGGEWGQGVGGGRRRDERRARDVGERVEDVAERRPLLWLGAPTRCNENGAR